ncbi:MAG: cupin domain-containing protein [Methylococcaceae bacterium]
MQATITNIADNIPEILNEELFNTLWRKKGIHIERIVSQGQVTQNTHWYDQAWDEWLLLVQGSARLRYELDNQSINLEEGDYLLIPAHTRHCVEWTSPIIQTIWLAIHVD